MIRLYSLHGIHYTRNWILLICYLLDNGVWINRHLYITILLAIHHNSIFKKLHSQVYDLLIIQQDQFFNHVQLNSNGIINPKELKMLKKLIYLISTELYTFQKVLNDK